MKLRFKGKKAQRLGNTVGTEVAPFLPAIRSMSNTVLGNPKEATW